MRAANQAEERKFLVDKNSAERITTIHGGPQVLVPFAVENGGHLDSHAQALLRPMSTVVIEKSRHPPLAYRAKAPSAPTLASLWVKRWQQRLSSWLYLAVSKYVLRLLCPDTAVRNKYIWMA
jgi:hypothetical protein